MFRSIWAGAFAFLVDFSILYFLTQFLKIYYLYSSIIGFFSGLSIVYILSINWVFFNRKFKNKFVEIVIFSFIGIVGAFLNTIFIWVFTESLSFNYLISKIVSTAIVFLWNFFAKKIFLF